MVDNPGKERSKAAAEFHRRVFAKHGNRCEFCGDWATDAAHIVPRSKLGPHRYACPEENGRPVCRYCHEAQESGKWNFSVKDRRSAVTALNAVLKTKLEMPT
jgi:predicted restriction endonuclease